MLDRFEILYSRARRLFSRSRWSSRLLGHPAPPAHADEPGLVLIQIDGLGKKDLDRALAEGTMPFLRQLVNTEGYELSPLYTGIPSNTPGAQAELFYGVRGAVPSFRYRDPGTGRILVMSERKPVSRLEAGLRREGAGLLAGGSAWSGIYTGGAAETHLCVSAKETGERGRFRGRLRIAGLVLWHGWSFFRVLGTLLFITAVAVRDWIQGRIDLRELWRDLHYVPFRVLVTGALREFVTAGACIDTERGLPVIHLNFPGFDEHAHRRGPDARSSRLVLRGIDRAIKRVAVASHRSTARDYQIWVYSDHGLEKVASFDRRRGESLPATVTRVYEWVRGIVGDEDAVPPFLAFPPLPGEARSQSLAEALPPWLGSLTPSPPERPRAGENGAEEGAVEVIYQGPLGFVYLPVRHRGPVLGWLAEVLAVEGGIPWVLVRRDDGGALAFSRDGVFHRLPEDAAAMLGKDHPHLRDAADDLVRLVHHDGAGDVVLLGWNRDEPLSFEIERGSHGGPGPLETTGFTIFSPETRSLTSIPPKLRLGDLREMALHILDRDEEPGEAGGRPGPAIIPSRVWLDRSPDSVRLRLMTYNVHGCRGMDGKYAPQRIARVIARERPDVVCLQELDQERTRSGGIDQVAVIARRLRTDYRFHAVADVDNGRFGNAVLSSFPLRLVKAGALPAAARVKDVFNLEDRGAVWVALMAGDREVQILNTHLSILEQERREQADALLTGEWLGHPDCTGPVILTGDFNASPDSWTLRRLETRLASAVGADRKDRELRTWSGRVPLRRIDHVMVSESVEVVGAYVPRTSLSRVASDHLPLVVDLICRLPAPSPVRASEYRH